MIAFYNGFSHVNGSVVMVLYGQLHLDNCMKDVYNEPNIQKDLPWLVATLKKNTHVFFGNYLTYFQLKCQA